MNTPPYDHAADLGPKRRAERGTIQAIVGGLVALLVVFGIEVPAEAAVAITGATVAIVGIIQNSYDAARQGKP